MKKARLIVAGIILFGLGGIAVYVSLTLFIVTVLCAIFVYELVSVELEQYRKEQYILAKQQEAEELEYERQLEEYRNNKYTAEWLNNIW